jgi:hypothetical protein
MKKGWIIIEISFQERNINKILKIKKEIDDLYRELKKTK